MAIKRVGLGTVLQCSTAASTSGYITLANVRNISRSGTQGTVIDVSTLDDADYYKTKAGGRVEPGQVTIGTIYDPADTTHKKLNSMMKNRTVGRWKLIFGSTTIFETWLGFVNGLGVEHPFDDAVAGDVTIEVTGDPGFTT